MRRVPFSAVVLGAAVAACEPRATCTGEYCGTLVFMAAGQVSSLLPPVTAQVHARDISDQIFLKLADIGADTRTTTDSAFVPLLAERWEWDDSLTLTFHLNPAARWHDGRPVTAVDVAFTFDAYSDPAVGAADRSSLAPISAVTARDSLTAVFRFRRRYDEMVYDAVYHMRILPAHLLRPIPRDRWATAEFGRRPVGNGPYRLAEWRTGEAIELVADSAHFLGRPHVRRLIWRFSPDLQTAVTQLVAGEADALDFLGPPANVQRVRETAHLAAYPYPGSTYIFLGFSLTVGGDTTRPHPLFGDRDVRRALAMTVDRIRLVRSVFGDNATVPPGPVSPLHWTFTLQPRPLPFDTLRAARMLAAAGWGDADGDRVRDKEGRRLAFSILVPTTSGIRRQYARLLQEQFRAVGAAVEIEEVELNVFTQRTDAGRFDAAVGAWSTDPSPASSVRGNWTAAGLGGNNWSRYVNPEVDRLIDEATQGRVRPAASRRAWTAALQLILDDAPAVFLAAPTNVAAVHRRVREVAIRPDAYWALVRAWRIPAEAYIERDRVER